MLNLDDQSVYKKYDHQGMLERIKEMPAQCQRAWQKAMDFTLPADYAKVDKVVILGMGGSAIGGDLAASLAISESRAPVFVCRDYNLPAYVDSKTLVIASSYSGNTEETLTTFEQALKTRAKKLVITTGGKLKEIAETNKLSVFTIDYKAQPRAALSYSLLPILCFLQKLGLVSDKSADVAEMVLILSNLSAQLGAGIASTRNPAKKLAMKLYGNLPVIYGSGIFSEVARRWKTQLNENSKAWSFHEVFPELNHNAVVGYQFPAEISARVVVVMLRSALLHKRVQLRYKITGELLEQAKVNYEIVDGEGKSALSQMMSLVIYGDYASYYLSLLYQTDPSPVKVIDYLKKRLSEASFV